jgi:hypothetical protein
MRLPLRRRHRRILALVAFRDEMRFLPGFLRNISPHVDGIVGLDNASADGSGDFVARHPKTLEVLRVEPGTAAEHHDGRDREALVRAAWSHAPDWLLGIDPDERLERRFRARAEREIDRAESEQADALWVPFRELWDRPDRMRVDGIWGHKRKACLFRASREHVFHRLRLHSIWASVSTAPESWPQADLLLYHLRMVDPRDRSARVARYEQMDPNHELQAIGYGYLLEEEGLTLEPLPQGRGWRR